MSATLATCPHWCELTAPHDGEPHSIRLSAYTHDQHWHDARDVTPERAEQLAAETVRAFPSDPALFGFPVADDPGSAPR